MKLIDLLVKIANNEEVPKEIRFRGELCSFDKEDKYYYCEEYGNIVWYLIDTNNMVEVLNTEVEIVEEKPKKIETFNLMYPISKEYEGEIGVLVSIYNSILGKIDVNIQDLTKAVNYLLEKESDK